MALNVKFLDSGRYPKNRPDPAYPNGIAIDLTNGLLPYCETALPYPARRCGYWLVVCDACGSRNIVTTAGRVDDPNSVKVPCLVVRQ